jgi:hypothetical protein
MTGKSSRIGDGCIARASSEKRKVGDTGDLLVAGGAIVPSPAAE